MNPVLTIAIPTYNRAELLDQQLSRLAQSIKGYESECEIIISDNCSTDNTPEVIDDWQQHFDGAALKRIRHHKNLGATRNIACCINSASGKYVWTISDDDPIHEDAVPYILRELRTHPNLSLIILNFSSRHWSSGRVLFDRCFDVEHESVCSNGRAVFERYLAHPNPARWGGLALTTALVYQADLARAAIRSWPGGLDNLTVQLYITAYCASQGSVKVSKDTYLECRAGTHFFRDDERMYLSFRYAEIPEAFLKLTEIGYSPHLCRTKVLSQSREFKWKFVARCFLRWPLDTAAVILRYVVAIVRAQALVLSLPLLRRDSRPERSLVASSNNPEVRL